MSVAWFVDTSGGVVESNQEVVMNDDERRRLGLKPDEESESAREERVAEFLKGVVWGKPLASVPMPTIEEHDRTVGDFWSLEEGRRRGYCR